ncbi:hypothetical protein DTO027B9_9110 [Paecilomyces variotii]|nr:hypothetical protein DTO027B9_9110 [Paecilomyces variotii]KAJ9403977.1 hypothetical protein DTO045G8_8258 [Paecilomyces variotii]
MQGGEVRCAAVSGRILHSTDKRREGRILHYCSLNAYYIGAKTKGGAKADEKVFGAVPEYYKIFPPALAGYALAAAELLSIQGQKKA